MRRIRHATALAVVAVLATGCSDAPETAERTTAAGAGSQGLEFAACMRDNGVEAFPDPDASGELTVDGVVNGSSIDTSGPAWNRAIEACKDLQPAGFTGRKRDPAQQDAALAFAQCIREHGVEDFPDPVEDAPLVDTRRIPSVADGDLTVLNAAMEACRDLGDEAINRRP